jgi:hypothetical protein
MIDVSLSNKEIHILMDMMNEEYNRIRNEAKARGSKTNTITEKEEISDLSRIHLKLHMQEILKEMEKETK